VCPNRAVFEPGTCRGEPRPGPAYSSTRCARSTPAAWGFAWNPSGYYTLALFAFITQAFLGIEVPLNMGGELTGHKVVTRHLLWGALLVLVDYFVTSFGVDCGAPIHMLGVVYI